MHASVLALAAREGSGPAQVLRAAMQARDEARYDRAQHLVFGLHHWMCVDLSAGPPVVTTGGPVACESAARS